MTPDICRMTSDGTFIVRVVELVHTPTVLIAAVHCCIQFDELCCGNTDVFTLSTYVRDWSSCWNIRRIVPSVTLHLLPFSFSSTSPSVTYQVGYFQQGLQLIDHCCGQVTWFFSHHIGPVQYHLCHSIELWGWASLQCLWKKHVPLGPQCIHGQETFACLILHCTVVV